MIAHRVLAAVVSARLVDRSHHVADLLRGFLDVCRRSDGGVATSGGESGEKNENAESPAIHRRPEFFNDHRIIMIAHVVARKRVFTQEIARRKLFKSERVDRMELRRFLADKSRRRCR